MMKLNGISQLQSKLRRNATMDDVKDVVTSNSAQMTRNSQRLAPVDTSNMKNNTLQFTENDGLTGGTRVHTDYGAYVDKGTRFMAARPFIGDSFELQSEIFKKEMDTLTK